MSSSVGVIIPNLMESHKSHVPNHQPELDVQYDLSCIEMGPLVFFCMPSESKHIMAILGQLESFMGTTTLLNLGYTPLYLW